MLAGGGLAESPSRRVWVSLPHAGWARQLAEAESAAKFDHWAFLASEVPMRRWLWVTLRLGLATRSI